MSAEVVETGEVAAAPMLSATEVSRRAGWPVRLTFDGDAVTVRPHDAKKYLRYARRAYARGRRPKKYGGNPCTAKPGTPEAREAFERGVLIPLRDWCRANADRVAACYCAPPRDGVAEFYVVTHQVRYDFELGHQLANLDLALHDAGWSVRAMQMPGAGGPEDLTALFDPYRAMVFDAQL